MNKSLWIYTIMLLTLSSCQRGCNRLERDLQISERNYEVILFSGGHAVFTDKFRGIINNSEHSDGIYYYKNDSLIEISGDYVIHSSK